MSVPKKYRSKYGYFFRSGNVYIGQTRYTGNKDDFEYFIQAKIADGIVIYLYKGKRKPFIKNVALLSLAFYPISVLFEAFSYILIVPALFLAVLSFIFECLSYICMFDFDSLKDRIKPLRKRFIQFINS